MTMPEQPTSCTCLLTAAELARLLRVRPGTILAWARKGAIPWVRTGARGVRFSWPAVIAAFEYVPADPEWSK